ncbi:MAG: signal peptide peptidase SppA [Rhodospirillaceae bacterium]
MRTLGKILLGILASFGLFFIVALVGLLYAISSFRDDEPRARAPDKIVLTLDLDEQLSEGRAQEGLANFGFKSEPKMQDMIIALRRAKDDPRVVALRATMSVSPLGLAQMQEVRDMVAEFETSGKPTFLFSETMGETVGAMSSYYLASAFNTIWVQPSGTVGVAGIGTEELFFKDFLERFGLKASFLQRKEYKSAGEALTNSAMSPANREALQALLGSWFDQMVAGIAESRKLAPETVRTFIDRGPLMAREAREGGLIDAMGYRDEFDAEVKKTAADASALDVGEYLDLGYSARGTSKKVAMINAVGTIVRGDEDDGGGLFNSAVGVRSGVMAKAVRDALEDDDIAAVLIRVDSPGGSYVASDTIWREIVKAKDKKKPVIVSMGNVAASGGYFIAMPADRVFAQPATVTGSIGVVMGKVVVAGALEKLDINWDRVTFGESAGIFNSTTDFTPAQLARLNEMIDATYLDFTSKAAQGRGKSLEEIEKVAKGRVWSGEDALTAGLVDELGGLSKAIDYTKTRVGLQPTDSLELVAFPKPKSRFAELLGGLENPDLPFGLVRALEGLARLGDAVGPLLNELEAANRPGVQLYHEPVRVK